MTNEQHNRYNRQIQLKEFGEQAQHKLLTARVLVIGAGGLGSPALQYLTAAGVGTLGVVDFDVVDVSNLQRQVLFTTNDIGKPKSEVAIALLRTQNPEVQFIEYRTQLTAQNAYDIISGFDIVLDGSDNFATRYLVNDACVLLNKPLVYGAVLRFEGQVAVFNMADANGVKTNYRDWFPTPPKPNEVLSCNQAGVLGVVPGIIGTMQANEVIKIITGIGTPLYNTVITYNSLRNTLFEFSITPTTTQHIPQTRHELEQYNYQWFCNVQQSVPQITTTEFTALLHQQNVFILDVREPDELPIARGFPYVNIPLRMLETQVPELTSAQTTVVFCQTGNRSTTAVQILQSLYPEFPIVSLHGGITLWLQQHSQEYYEQRTQ